MGNPELTACIEHLVRPHQHGPHVRDVGSTLLQTVLPVLTSLGWDVSNADGHNDVVCESGLSGDGATENLRLHLYPHEREYGRRPLADVELVTLWDPVTRWWGQPPTFRAHIGVRTDGFTWRVYHSPETGRAGVLVETVRFTVQPANVASDSLDRLLSADRLRNGKALADLEQKMRQRAEEPHLNPLVRLVDEARQSDPNSPLDGSTADLVEQVAVVYRLPEHTHKELHETVTATVPAPAAEEPQPSKSLTLFGHRIEVTTWRDAYRAVIDEVCRWHSRQLLTTFAGHQFRHSRNQDEYRKPVPVGDTGYYTEGHGNSADLEKRARRLVVMFGHSPEDVQFHREQQPKKRQRTKAQNPTAVTVLGYRFDVSTWRKAYQRVLSVLYREHSNTFLTTLSEHGFRYSANPDDHRSAIPLGSSGYYTDSHGSAEHLRKQSGRLMQMFGHSTTDVEYHLQTGPAPKPGTADPQPKDRKKRSPKRKPVAVTVLGERTEVSTWREAWETVLAEIHREHGDEFMRTVESTLSTPGQGAHTFSTDSAHYKLPAPVGTSGYYTQQALDERTTRSRGQRMLEVLGHSAADLTIETTPDPDDTAPAAEPS